jgi:aryl-alcohol dehydrogenase-like predicted oxidoreductase
VHIVTKAGWSATSTADGGPANSPPSLRERVHDNLRRLGLDVVNLRTLAGIDDRATVS